MVDSSRCVTDGVETGYSRRLRPDGGRDRQSLIVGDLITGAVTAGFLDQAGLDPVLVPETDAETPRGPVLLWKSGLNVLERIGLRRPVERIGTPLNTLDCLTTEQSWDGDGMEQPPLLAVDREQLIELLDKRLLNRVRVVEQPVTGIEPTDTGVRVHFDAIAEPFDTVATTTRTIDPDLQRGDETPTVHQWAFEWPSGLSAPEGPTEAWRETQAAFSVPYADGRWVDCVSTGETTPASPVAVDELASRFGHLVPGTPFGELDSHRLQYRTLAAGPSTEMIDGRVAFVGPATAGAIPGDALSPTLGIEDGWVLADALAYGPDDIDAALADYERRRRQRRADITAFAEDRTAMRCDETDRSPILEQLCGMRSVAFSHVLDHTPPEDIPTTVDEL